MVPHYSIADPLGLSPEQLLSYPTASHAPLWWCCIPVATCMLHDSHAGDSSRSHYRRTPVSPEMAKSARSLHIRSLACC